MMAAESTTRGIWLTIGNRTPATNSMSAALIRTDSDVFAPKARLATLGPILIPLVMPPQQADRKLPAPRRIRSRLPSTLGAPGGVTSLAHSSASIAATTASAKAPATMSGNNCAKSFRGGNSPIIL